ncbi:hypothetical protein J6590_040764 [Homalodisca vitripennis]|nr:hypothetical protein J6590_040764 [Homalodisca vitripennis]
MISMNVVKRLQAQPRPPVELSTRENISDVLHQLKPPHSITDADSGERGRSIVLTIRICICNLDHGMHITYPPLLHNGLISAAQPRLFEFTMTSISVSDMDSCSSVRHYTDRALTQLYTGPF